MRVEKRHHAFIKSQASTKAYAKSSSNPIRGGKYLLDHLIHFPANARLFLRVNFLVSAAGSLCDCGSVILPLGCRWDLQCLLCGSKQSFLVLFGACIGKRKRKKNSFNLHFSCTFLESNLKKQMFLVTLSCGHIGKCRDMSPERNLSGTPCKG